MSKFGSEIVGRTFKKGSVVFMVMGVDSYPAKQVSSRFSSILSFPAGKLVAVSHRGILIPNITVRGGVARLTKVATRGVSLSTPKAISGALGISKSNHPYTLRRID